MAKNFFLKREEQVLRDDQLNELNQITDKKILNRDRIKFGVGSVMYQSEESAFIPIHTAIIRALGGTDIHLGLIGAATSSAGSLCQWVGSILLRVFSSNRTAMLVALSFGVVFAMLLCLSVLGGMISPLMSSICAVLYIVFLFGLSGSTGAQNNIESNWIGDLVPISMRGWFTSVKWMISALGVLILVISFGQIAVRWPTLPVYSAAFIYMAVTTLIAMWLISTVTERKPQTVYFFKSDIEKNKLDYTNKSLWKFVWFLGAWAAGRTALMAFSTAYMIDILNFKMDRIVILFGISSLVSICILFVMGQWSDRIGTRIPLLLISGGVALSMLLWVASGWWGVWAIILYQIINGAAGNTHTMLSINFALETLPAEGRSAYLSVARMAVGIIAMISAISAGFIMSFLRGHSAIVFGVTLNHYQIFFIGCIVITLSCVIPLITKSTNRN